MPADVTGIGRERRIVTTPARSTSLSGFLLSALLAAVLIGAFTGLRAALNPILGSHSPHMLYIAAVLLAGFARGGLCGLMTLLGGGVAGQFFFTEGQDSWTTPAALTSLAVFLAVGLMVLGMAHELGQRANRILDKVRPAEDETPDPPQG